MLSEAPRLWRRVNCSAVMVQTKLGRGNENEGAEVDFKEKESLFFKIVLMIIIVIGDSYVLHSSIKTENLL